LRFLLVRGMGKKSTRKGRRQRNSTMAGAGWNEFVKRNIRSKRQTRAGKKKKITKKKRKEGDQGVGISKEGRIKLQIRISRKKETISQKTKGRREKKKIRVKEGKLFTEKRGKGGV